MRILQISPTMGHGGIAMMMKMYAEELASKGVVFDFLHHGKEEDFHKDLKQLGSRFFTLQPMGKIGYRRYFEGLRRVIEENGPYDAIHINMNYQSGRYAKMAKACGVQNRIIHVHGVSFYRSFLKLLMPIFKAEIRRYGTHFCSDSSQCGRFYYDSAPFDVIPVAIDTSIYADIHTRREELRARFDLTDADVAIGHIAAFLEVKNHVFDVRLLEKLTALDDGKNYKMIFAGNGPLRADIEAAFAAAGLSDRVLFLGNIDYVPAYLAAMDVTILPSFSEGFGQVLIQSQAAGVPCIASDTLPRESDMHMGLAQYLPIDGDDAVDNWARTISTLSHNEMSYNQCKDGLDRAGYSIEVAAQKLLTIYAGG